MKKTKEGRNKKSIVCIIRWHTYRSPTWDEDRGSHRGVSTTHYHPSPTRPTHARHNPPRYTINMAELAIMSL